MKRLVSILIALALVATTASAKEKTAAAQNYFTDVVLKDQNGNDLRFYTDVLKGKTVIIESFFADCTSVCPMMNSTLKKVQKALGDRVGKDVFLVSITVNAKTDTPARLKTYAKHVGAGPGWIFLTGKQDNVKQALHKLGLSTEVPDNHKNLFLVGNESTGLWKKVFGLGNADEIIKIVQGVANDKVAAR